MIDADSQLEPARQRIATFYDAVVPRDFAVTAREGTASRWSELGTVSFPASEPVLRMLMQATEIGYAAALQDVCDGDFDSDLAEWRLGLNGQA